MKRTKPLSSPWIYASVMAGSPAVVLLGVPLEVRTVLFAVALVLAFIGGQTSVSDRGVTCKRAE